MRVLNEVDVLAQLDVRTALQAAHDAFVEHTAGGNPPLGRIDAYLEQGEFHVKSGFAAGIFAVKANSGFFGNPPGTPAIQGAVLAFDAATGTPLGVVHSGSLTRLRTAAATAVAARALSLEHSQVLGLVGAGSQAWEHVRALAEVRPLTSVRVWSRSIARAEELARRVSEELSLQAEVAQSPSAAAAADIVVTVTPSTTPLLCQDDLRPGTFVAAVGGDSPGKQELDPRVLARSAVVCDVVSQCVTAGELHHAVEAGLMSVEDVRAELGQVLTGTREARLSDAEVVVFDSTGTGFQDAAAAAALLT